MLGPASPRHRDRGPAGEPHGDEEFSWFVGLDAEATHLGNALWRGEPLEDDAQARVLALFRLAFADQGRIDPRVSGRPVYLLLAMTGDKMVTLKPQNLIVGLPVRTGAEVA